MLEEYYYNGFWASSFIHAVLANAKKDVVFIYDEKEPRMTFQDIDNYLPRSFFPPNIIITSLMEVINASRSLNKKPFLFNMVYLPIFHGFFTKYKSPGDVPKTLLFDLEEVIYSEAKELMLLGQELLKNYSQENPPKLGVQV